MTSSPLANILQAGLCLYDAKSFRFHALAKDVLLVTIPTQIKEPKPPIMISGKNATIIVDHHSTVVCPETFLPISCYTNNKYHLTIWAEQEQMKRAWYNVRMGFHDNF